MDWLDVASRVALAYVAVTVFGYMVYLVVVNFEIRRK
jgi:hypothetical protein